MNIRLAVLVGSLIGCSSLIAEEDTKAFNDHIRPFLEEYCIKCHGPDKQKGERRFDTLAYPISDDNALIDFQDMLDLLNLGDMPPEDEEQPSSDQRQAIVDWLTQEVNKAYESRSFTGGETVLRRLNHREYLNTINDLFQMDMSMFDPTESFPGERLVEHQDNIGDTLITSGYLLNRYVDAADQIVEKALPFQDKPEPQTWNFKGGFQQQPELNKRHMVAHGQRYLNIYEGPNTVRRFGAYAPLYEFVDGVPEGGVYKIRTLAEAVNRYHSFNRKKVQNDPDEPMMMRVIPANKRFGYLHMPQPFAPDLGTFALSDDGPAWYETEAWLDKGFAPRYNYLNGSMDIRPGFREVANLVIKNADPAIPPKDLDEDYMAVAIKHGVIPHIRIHEVEVSGPFYPEWPTRTWMTIVGEEVFNPKKTRHILQVFASRAYRKPASRDEVNRLMRVVEARVDQGSSGFEAMKDGLKAVLISPAFLYLEEEKQKSKTERLGDFGLASRLSYFLWGSLPDQELLDLAKRKRLSRPSVLKSQMDRMLKDPRSDRFISGFLDSWLTLRSLGDAPPDRNKFEVYYAENLEDAMRMETEMFTRNALKENLNISCFLDSDFTFVNEALAEIYGIDGIEGDNFRRIELNDPRRGGLLGQASILTVTANGVDTSPVLRGVWLLENLLGTPPSPPPPDVEPLDPDIRGAESIRDQLNKHRETQACYECHRKIDPLGFALENFDPIGRWRSKYDDRIEIDASGQLPSGESFNDIVEFKKAMLEKKDAFTRALTKKMLSYALGRRLEISDRPEIDSILETLEENGDGFRDLVYLIISSESFASP
ncbi:MAG: DUF1592 domain-containing protein [Verrucomicrobia bacterium]|nr:DUF1592 domain-containing protein [Verrucomicrobiota bacterium]MDA1068401.1 DUF1592 domain-containing protein [Verrucomicrobiota bacterium]